MKKIHKKLPLVLASTTLPTIFAFMTISCKKTDPNEKPNAPQKPDENKPSENPSVEVDKKLKNINDWVINELNGNLSVIIGKEKEFQEAIKNENSFWYDRYTGKVIVTEKGSKPNWSSNKNFILEFKGINIPKNYQVVNVNEPTWDNGQKLSSKLDYEIDKDNNIIFKYKGAIYQGKDKKHTISTTIGSSNLGKIIDADTLAKMELMNEKANKETSFDYPNKAETYLKDANLDKIIKNIPEDYELATYKPVKNEDKDYYDVTIIFKLKIKGTDIVMSRNASYVIKGWKKTDEILNFEKVAKERIGEEISKIKVFILDEKAYQHVIKHKTINNFDNKPNFIINGYDTNLYNMELSNINITNISGKNQIKIMSKMSVKNNPDIFVEKEIIVESEYSKGKNFHNLNEDEIKAYISEQLAKTTIYPKYSKDRTYIEKLNNGKISNKSFWIESIDHNLNYNFGFLSKENNDYYIEVKASILNWLDSPFIIKKIKIDFSNLGIEILNEIRKNKGQDPLPDETAPTATINEEVEPDLSIDKFVDTPTDEHKSTSAPQLNNFLNKVAYLYAWDEDIYNAMAESPDKKLVQFYNVNNHVRKSNIYFFDNIKSIRENQTIYVFSKPEYKDNLLTVKITAISLQDYNAGSFDQSRMASKRIEIKKDKWGKDIFDQYINSVKINEEIKKLNLTYDFKNKETLDSKEVSKWKSDKLKENLIINNLPVEYQIIKIGKSSKTKNKTLTLFLYFKKGDIESIVSVKIMISNFKS